MIEIRKIVICREEIFHEGGPAADTTLLRGAILAVIKNPYAGRYEPDIQGFMQELEPLGVDLAKRLVTELGGDPTAICAVQPGRIGISCDFELADMDKVDFCRRRRCECRFGCGDRCRSGC